MPYSRSLPVSDPTHPLSRPETLRPFAYKQLDPTVDCIRLVIIEPCSRNALLTVQPIHCRLKHVAFSERPKYEALSYAWGDEDTKHWITIDTQDYYVGSNLLQALIHLRLEGEERVLWIDALSINQKNAEEKSRQISIMPYIYTRAKKVLVWLGVLDEELLKPLEDESSKKTLKKKHELQTGRRRYENASTYAPYRVERDASVSSNASSVLARRRSTYRRRRRSSEPEDVSYDYMPVDKKVNEMSVPSVSDFLISEFAAILDEAKEYNTQPKISTPISMLLQSMCQQPYWHRLWIIQEISLAREIDVYYGDLSVSWDDFIDAVKADSLRSRKGSNIPLRFQQQLEEKYGEGHKLQNLIENHQHAICTEPRDHIYGFVGLATDCIEGFPLDYRKTLFEVWKDTVMFKNADWDTSQDDTMSFGRLVQRLLGGRNIAAADEITRDLTLRMAQCEHEDVGANDVLCTSSDIMILGRVIGRVSYLGPTHKEIISELQKTAAWKASIDRLVPSVSRPQARRENDKFLQLLEDEEYDLKSIAPIHPAVSWEPHEMPQILLEMEENDLDTRPASNPALSENQTSLDAGYNERDSAITQRETPISTPTGDLLSPNQILFLLGMRVEPQNDGYALERGRYPSDHDTPGRMGLAPCNIRKGDYIIQIQGIERAFVLRKEENLLSVVGIAMLAFTDRRNSRTRSRQRNRRGWHDEYSRSREYSRAPGNPVSDQVELFVDVAIAYRLLM